MIHSKSAHVLTRIETSTFFFFAEKHVTVCRIFALLPVEDNRTLSCCKHSSPEFRAIFLGKQRGAGGWEMPGRRSAGVSLYKKQSSCSPSRCGVCAPTSSVGVAQPLCTRADTWFCPVLQSHCHRALGVPQGSGSVSRLNGVCSRQTQGRHHRFVASAHRCCTWLCGLVPRVLYLVGWLVGWFFGAAISGFVSLLISISSYLFLADSIIISLLHANLVSCDFANFTYLF